MGAGVRHPRATLALWLAVLVVLAGIGVGVENRLTRADLAVPGTGSADARELTREHFGESHQLVVLLEGPRRELDRQGRRLAAGLDADPHLVVAGPWGRGSAQQLRPTDGKALVLVRAERPFREVSEDVVPQVRDAVRHDIKAPLKGYVTGYPDVGAGVHNESVKALKQAELVAAPLLLIVLLLVFRSVVAAVLPLVLGIAAIAASRGLIDIVNRFMDVDIVALNMASMMGLALGVDYSLILVSRFREELRAGRDATDAARVASGTAGRTILFAGIALGAAMTAALAVSPGALLVSSGVGVLSAATISILAAVSALPAALVLLGDRVDKWSFGGRRREGGGWGATALRLASRPALAAGVILALLLALSAPALALSLGSPDPRSLPESSVHRRDFEHLSKSLGAGWSAPFEIVVAAKDGKRITDPVTLQKLDAWQTRLARDKGVEAVMGPAPIARGARRIKEFEQGLGDAQKQIGRARRDQAKLQSGLGKVDDGVGELRGGLALASDGATRLESGAGDAATGAQRLGDGIQMADRGASKLLAGLTEARKGAGELKTGSGELTAGARKLKKGLRKARRESAAALPQVEKLRKGLDDGSSGLTRLREPAQKADQSLTDALGALDRMLPTSKADPSYVQALTAVATAKGAVSGVNPVTRQKVDPEYDGMDAELATASEQLKVAASGVKRLENGMGELVGGLRELETGAGKLERGLVKLEDGTIELRSGLRRLERGGGDLSSGLDRLTAGSQELATGAGRLRDGAGELSTGLSDGATRSQALEDGVGRMENGVTAGRARTDKLTKKLGGNQVDTALFDSGYMPLAALDRAPKAQRTGATFTVNLDRGGDATRIVVIQQDQEGMDALRPRLEKAADRIARDTGTTTAVGGPGATLQDFESEAQSRLPLLILSLVVVTFIALVPTLRSLVLPLLAVLLNVLTVAAAFGVLVLGFQGSAPLGGVGELDAIMVLAIFAIVFGLSIDYEVFLLARMREGYDRFGDTGAAVDYGVQKTASVITGGAMIMIGVFAAFAIADIASMRQLGIGLTVAVLLDATIVRLVLLPALIRLCGDASWWLPGWLDRLLPHMEVEAEPTGDTRDQTLDLNGNGTVTQEFREAVAAARAGRSS